MHTPVRRHLCPVGSRCTKGCSPLPATIAADISGFLGKFSRVQVLGAQTLAFENSAVTGTPREGSGRSRQAWTEALGPCPQWAGGRVTLTARGWRWGVSQGWGVPGTQ